LLKYDFEPVQENVINNLKKEFILGGSKILTPDLINAEFLLEVMPRRGGEVCAHVELLYQHSAYQTESAQNFHSACDEQGPTLTFVKANGGFIFGGYNPQSWLSDFMYTTSDEAYIFQVYSPVSHMPNPNAQAQSLSAALEISTKGLKDIKNPEITIYPPKGPVKCVIRAQKKDKAIK